MAEPIPISFGTQSDPGRHRADTGPRHINAHIGVVVEGKAPFPIYARDGLNAFATIADGGACRGLIEAGAEIIGLSGTRFFRVDATGAATLVGGIPGSGKAILARNAKPGSTQTVIVSDASPYFYEAGILAPINEPNLPPPSSADFLNQRILFGIPNGRMYWSTVSEATEVSSLDFIEAEGHPDGLVRLKVHNQEVWLLGERTTEVVTDTGAAAAPFRRKTAAISKGCAARHSVVVLDKDMFWLGDDGSVYAAQGYGYQRVSHHGVERSIGDTAIKADIEAFGYFNRGHAYYVLSGPDWTWTFNRTTGKWFEARSHGLSRWRASGVARLGEKTIVGDYQSGALYEVSQASATDGAEFMTVTLRSPPLHAYPKRMSVYRFFADFQTGVGLGSDNPHVADPVVALRWLSLIHI